MQAAITVALCSNYESIADGQYTRIEREADFQNSKGDLAPVTVTGYGRIGESLSTLQDGFYVVIGDLRMIKEDGETFVSIEASNLLPCSPDESKAYPSQVTVVGTLGSEPEVKYFDSGNVNAKFSLATNPSKDVTDWIPVAIWGKGAEIAADYCRKRQQHAVSGSLDFNLTDYDRIYWVISCNGRTALTLLRNKKEESTSTSSKPASERRQATRRSTNSAPTTEAPVATSASLDEIPF